MIDHFLKAELIVPVSQAEAFEAASAAFLDAGGFGRFNAEYGLNLALKSVESFPYRGYGRYDQMASIQDFRAGGRADLFRDESMRANSSVYRYIHLWAVPRLLELDLEKVMQACVDDELYLSIDAHVASETQNFVRLVHQFGFPPQVIDSSDEPQFEEFVRSEKRFGRADVGKYLFDWGTNLPSWEQQHWHSLGQYQNVTGMLNVVTELWQTTADYLPALSPPVAAVGLPTLPLPTAEFRERYHIASYFNRGRVRFG